MARVNGIGDREAGWLTRLVYAGARRMSGQVPDPLRIMAHSKSVMWAAGLYELASARGSAVDAKLKTLASIKAASRIGCLF
jgi:hypothetical protein